MATISTYVRTTVGRRANSTLQIEGCVRRTHASVPGGVDWFFAADTPIFFAGVSAATIAANKPARLWGGTKQQTTLDLSHHAYVIFCRVGDGQLWFAAQEDFAAIAAGHDVGRVAWVDSQHDLVPRFGVSRPAQPGVVGWSGGKILLPINNYATSHDGNLGAVQSSLIGAFGWPGAGGGAWIGRNRIVIAPDGGVLLTDEVQTLWYGKPDDNLPFTQVLVPSVAGSDPHGPVFAINYNVATATWWLWLGADTHGPYYSTATAPLTAADWIGPIDYQGVDGGFPLWGIGPNGDMLMVKNPDISQDIFWFFADPLTRAPTGAADFPNGGTADTIFAAVGDTAYATISSFSTGHQETDQTFITAVMRGMSSPGLQCLIDSTGGCDTSLDFLVACPDNIGSFGAYALWRDGGTITLGHRSGPAGTGWDTLVTSIPNGNASLLQQSLVDPTHLTLVISYDLLGPGGTSRARVGDYDIAGAALVWSDPFDFDSNDSAIDGNSDITCAAANL